MLVITSMKGLDVDASNDVPLEAMSRRLAELGGGALCVDLFNASCSVLQPDTLGGYDTVIVADTRSFKQPVPTAVLFSLLTLGLAP